MNKSHNQPQSGLIVPLKKPSSTAWRSNAAGAQISFAAKYSKVYCFWRTVVRRYRYFCSVVFVLTSLLTAAGAAQQADRTAMDRDLLEATVTQLQSMYASGKYTVSQVTQWHLNRIVRFNGVYRAIVHVDSSGALAAAAAMDVGARNRGRNLKRGPLWGVPVVIKSNTSVKGLVTNNGWRGYMIPGKELIAPMDAPIVAKLRAAGAIILGQTNMPDFAASDTNLSSAYGRTGNAYDWHFSPGGSSGGTVTAVSAGFSVLGTGTDTSNSIRMPSSTSAVVGMLPTRGLVSTAGIHPLDWLLDNAGPIARDVTDAAIALDVMASEDPRDFRTAGSAVKAQPRPFTKYLKTDALKGKRFGAPAFIVREPTPGAQAPGIPLQPETRAVFMKAIDGLRAAGAAVVFGDDILPDSFMILIGAVNTAPYQLEGTETFLRDFGPAGYHSAAEYAKAVGVPLPGIVTGRSPQKTLRADPDAERNFWAPQRRALAAYNETLEKFQLDGFVYPGLQMPSNNETIPQPDGRPSSGPHSSTGWVNSIGVPAIVVPGGFHANGMPFGLEISGRQWKDGDLLGWAFAYEQATKHRRAPVLVDKP